MVAKERKLHDHPTKDVLDFFGDGPSFSVTNDEETTKPASVTDVEKRRQRKRKVGVDTETSESDSHSDSEDTELMESGRSDSSDDEDVVSEEEEGEGGELQLFAGHTPLEWKKGGASTKRKKERMKRKKRKKMNKETREILRRQEVI